MTPRRTPRLPAAVLSLALAGCGSTVQVTSSTQVDNGLGGVTTGSTLPGAGGATGSTGSTGVLVDGASSTTGTALGGSGSTSGTPGGSGPSTSTATSGVTPGPTSSLATGLGVTATTVTIGIAYSSNADQANAAIGGGALTSGDERANAEALVAEVNSKGGVAGRKLVAVYQSYDNTSSSPGSVQDQSACDKWTRDSKVLAVFSNNLTEVLPACLNKVGVVYLRSGIIVGDDRVGLRQHPKQFLLGALVQERFLTDLVASLTRQKYFSGWDNLNGRPGTAAPKLAVMTYDDRASTRAVDSVLLPGLRQAGHPVDATDVFRIAKPASQSDVSGTAAQIKSATLRMQQDGVTHLVFNDASGLLMGLFATNARTQTYFPRYGLTSGAGPQGIYDTGLVQSNQLVGMAGNGWLPSLDLPAADGTKLATPATKRCLKILQERTGQTYTSTNAASIALGNCSQMFLFVEGMKRAPSLSPAGLVAGIEALKDSFDSPFLPQAYYGPDRHDEGQRGWDLNWDAACPCVRYSSQHAIP